MNLTMNFGSHYLNLDILFESVKMFPPKLKVKCTNVRVRTVDGAISSVTSYKSYLGASNEFDHELRHACHY